MEATEFRLGNLIYSKEVDLQNSCEKKVEVPVDLYILQELINGNKSGKYSPIPTSAQFLLDHGFIKHFRHFNYTKKDLRITLTIKNEWVCPDALPSDWVYLPYVHQVQNLYFALKGEEL